MVFGGIGKLFFKLKNGFSLRHWVISIVMAWCFVSVVQTFFINIKQGYTVDNLNFTGQVNYLFDIICIIGLAVILYAVYMKLKKPMLEKVMLFVVTFFYSIIITAQYDNTFYCLLVAGLMVFSVAYCFEGVNTQLIKIHSVTYKLILAIGFVTFVGVIGGSLVLKYLTYSSPNFDLGLFSQMFHYMSSDLSMKTTSERDVLLSHFCVHISPIFYCILPLYMLYKSAATLQFAQALVIGLAVFPLAGICRHLKLSRFETALFCIAYLLYPVVSGGCFYDIHENIFLPLCIFTLLYYCEKESWIGIIISTVFLLGVKEDAAVYAVCIGLYTLFYKKMYKKSIFIIVISGLYFIFTTELLSKIGEGVMSYRFDNMIYGGGGSMVGIIRTVITNPAYILTQIMQQEKIEFIIQTLAPLCFMPLFSKKWYRFIFFIPYVLFNLMSDYQYFHSIYFQYVFGSGALLFYLSVRNVADIDIKLRSRIIPMVTVASSLFFITLVSEKVEKYYNYYSDKYERSIYKVLDEAVSSVPENASVTATTFLCPALSNRDVLYELYYTDKESETEYTVLDLRVATTEYNVNTYLDSEDYEVVYYVPFRVGVFKNKKY
jgi:uncharacterized membrane protein